LRCRSSRGEEGARLGKWRSEGGWLAAQCVIAHLEKEETEVERTEMA